MITMENFKNDFIKKIENNIEQFGHHITMVIDSVEPRFAYTIGVNKILGIELVFAGGIFYMKEEVFQIINEIVEILRIQGLTHTPQKTSLGIFNISSVHHSWKELMMLGLNKFYENNKFPVLQIIPTDGHYTLDVPDMLKEWNVSSQPVWQWLSKDWDYAVPKDSKIITNLNALRGEAITEVTRWEVDEWEAFAGAGPDVGEEDIRIISLGTLLGIDKSLEAILRLDIGKGIWRDNEELIWNDWN